MADEGNVTIIKKIKKGGHAHHGGAWKVAYADFVTAMMAFFLLLWLLNSVTQEQLEGISNYFAPASISATTSGAGGILGGQTMNAEGSMVSDRSKPTISLELPPPKLGTGGESAAGKEAETVSEEQAQKVLEEKENEQFEQAAEEIKQAIESVPSLKELARSLILDDTAEGLRIQIVDQDGLAMFPSGSADMYEHTYRVLGLVAKVVASMPQKIAISGHTDASQFVTSTGYSNWELSADRANASRRALVHLGVPDDRVARVVGKADTEPLLKETPKDAKNRRISIVLLRESRQKAKEQSKPISVVPDSDLPTDGKPTGEAEGGSPSGQPISDGAPTDGAQPGSGGRQTEEGTSLPLPPPAAPETTGPKPFVPEELPMNLLPAPSIDETGQSTIELTPGNAQ